MVQMEGKGTEVERPKYCVMGWKNLIELACGIGAIEGRENDAPDLWKFDSEVAQQNQHCALPLLFRGGDFLLFACQSYFHSGLGVNVHSGSCTS